MRLRQKLLPWRPALVFTGRSYYTVESATGRLATQTDVWDAIKDNSYLSARPCSPLEACLLRLGACPCALRPIPVCSKRAFHHVGLLLL